LRRRRRRFAGWQRVVKPNERSAQGSLVARFLAERS